MTACYWTAFATLATPASILRVSSGFLLSWSVINLSALFWQRSSWPSRVEDIQGCQVGAAWLITPRRRARKTLIDRPCPTFGGKWGEYSSTVRRFGGYCNGVWSEGQGLANGNSEEIVADSGRRCRMGCLPNSFRFSRPAMTLDCSLYSSCVIVFSTWCTRTFAGEIAIKVRAVWLWKIGEHSFSVARLDRTFWRWMNSDRGDIEGKGVIARCFLRYGAIDQVDLSWTWLKLGRRPKLAVQSQLF